MSIADAAAQVTWKSLVLAADPYHANADGSRALGEAVAAVARDLPSFRRLR